MSGIMSPDERKAALAREARVQAPGASVATWLGSIAALLFGVVVVLLGLTAVIWATRLLFRIGWGA